MSKNIQTHNAKIDLIKKFLDYANCADASYAMLHYIRKNAENETQENKADNLTFGDKLQQDIEVTNHKGETIKAQIPLMLVLSKHDSMKKR